MPALKVGGLKKKSAELAITAKVCASVIGPEPGISGLEKTVPRLITLAHASAVMADFFLRPLHLRAGNFVFL